MSGKGKISKRLRESIAAHKRPAKPALENPMPIEGVVNWFKKLIARYRGNLCRHCKEPVDMRGLVVHFDSSSVAHWECHCAATETHMDLW